MTDPSSCQRRRPTSIKQQLSDSNINLVFGPRWGLVPRLTGRLIVGRKAALTLTGFQGYCIDTKTVYVVYKCYLDIAVTKDAQSPQWSGRRDSGYVLMLKLRSNKRSAYTARLTPPLAEEGASFLKHVHKKKTLRDLSPQANYTDRASAACRRSLAPTFEDRGCRVVTATNPHGR
jgi:hypothetical protein